MDYQKIAGDILFGGSTLDKAARGMFIEALVFDALRRHEQTIEIPNRWRYTGLGWGPWDLQRGIAKDGTRVQFQVKAKAARQRWVPSKTSKHEYDLGLSLKESLPGYFARDFPPETYGECEASGYRTDFFVLAWHDSEDQSDLSTYDFYIVCAAELLSDDRDLPRKKIAVAELRARYPAITFSELASKLNEVADGFVSSQMSSLENLR